MPDGGGRVTENRDQTPCRGVAAQVTQTARGADKNLSPAPCLPFSGTFLAFDFGTRRIGVAVGNSVSGTAQPLVTLHGEQNEQRFSAIAALISEWQPAALVVGLPGNDDGTPHEMTRLCRRFARRLKGRFDLPAILVDERYTSAAASSQLNEAGIRGIKQKALLDQVAAQQILRAYFDEPSSGHAA
ncbi:MAG: Holliday junction resolvase RuvX [Nitrosomonadales bacterium]|nr:Holliday junction resolvase RuvX [Nitrosomonadales bacterium]